MTTSLSYVFRAVALGAALVASVATTDVRHRHKPFVDMELPLHVPAGASEVHRFRVTVDGHPRRLTGSIIIEPVKDGYYEPVWVGVPELPPICRFASDLTSEEPIRFGYGWAIDGVPLGTACGDIGPCAIECTITCDGGAAGVDGTLSLTWLHVFDGSGTADPPPGIFEVTEVTP